MNEQLKREIIRKKFDVALKDFPFNSVAIQFKKLNFGWVARTDDIAYIEGRIKTIIRQLFKDFIESIMTNEDASFISSGGITIHYTRCGEIMIEACIDSGDSFSSRTNREYCREY
jgi:hypothetical protein